MKTHLLTVVVAIGALAFASVGSLERQSDGRLGVTLESQADALKCCKRFVRAMKKFGNTVKDTAKTMASGVKTAAEGVAKVAKGAAKVAKGAVTAVKGAGDVIKGAAKAAGHLVKGDVKGAKADMKAGIKDAKKDAKAGLKDIKAGAKEMEAGLDVVKQGIVKLLKPVWLAAKKLSCSGLLDKLFSKGAVNKTDTKDWNVGHYIGACGQEFTKGLVCGIPDIFTELLHMAQTAFEYAWKNRKVCFTAGLIAGMIAQGPQPTALIGPLLCGAGYYLKATVPKAISCLKDSLLGKNSGAGKALGVVAMEMGCNIIGSLIPDVIIAILSAGAAGPPLIAKQIAKMTTSIAAKLPATLVKNVTKFAKVKDALGKLKTAFDTLNKKSSCQAMK